jgi:hypothetical protein
VFEHLLFVYLNISGGTVVEDTLTALLEDMALRSFLFSPSCKVIVFSVWGAGGTFLRHRN